MSEWLCAPDNRFDLIAPPPPRLDRRTHLLFSKDEFDLFVNDRGFVPQRRVDDTARAQAAKAYQKIDRAIWGHRSMVRPQCK